MYENETVIYCCGLNCEKDFGNVGKCFKGQKELREVYSPAMYKRVMQLVTCKLNTLCFSVAFISNKIENIKKTFIGHCFCDIWWLLKEPFCFNSLSHFTVCSSFPISSEEEQLGCLAVRRPERW